MTRSLFLLFLHHFHKEVLSQFHDSLSEGHLDTDKTLDQAHQVWYWVNMIGNVEAYCHECSACQAAKLPSPQRVPLTSVPIEKPWQMVAINILEGPHSPKNICYLLVVQNYFTKLVEAIPCWIKLLHSLPKHYSQDLHHLRVSRNCPLQPRLQF